MEKEIKGFMLFTDQKEAICCLDDAEAGILFKALYPKSGIRDFSCKKLDYSRLFHRYSIYILTQYASFTLFQDKMKAKFSNDRFGFMAMLPMG